MKFSVSRESLLAPLQLISGIVEKKQTMPVLSNILLVVDKNQVSLTGTNMEVELVCRVDDVAVDHTGKITVPAKKLAEICRSLTDSYPVEISLEGDKLHIHSGNSQFVLATLPADHFPNTENDDINFSIFLSQKKLKHALDATAFAMAQQDVRYYLNGMLFEIRQETLRLVATDGHRLALANIDISSSLQDSAQIIVPRKGVIELGRLLTDEGEEVQLEFGSSHIRSTIGSYTFSSKLIEGKFPDYNRVIPRGGDKIVIAERVPMKEVLVRAAILSHENIRGIRVSLQQGQIEVVANNPEHEQAEDYLEVDYHGEPLEIGFNVSYLIDVMNCIQQDKVKMILSNPNSSALIEPFEGDDVVYVVMPMRL
ncbi:MAG: DNA polymerase III subunit beta [Gammaproteobacteria bacterium]|nr:MAG: DNA polymerase III subunit beta [Pseudomonadota bacterium]PIE38289.1 MAG: DNA polymerase III subunit beta [Gammaproteobacteria bacterium]